MNQTGASLASKVGLRESLRSRNARNRLEIAGKQGRNKQRTSRKDREIAGERLSSLMLQL
jgi:hypothetical protein